MRIAATILLLCSVFKLAYGDTWKFPDELVVDEFVFGSARIVRTMDASENNQFPIWKIEIFREKALQAIYKGVWFEDIVANTDNTVFFGISNSGLPGTAVVIFDYKGNLLFERKHEKELYDYCSWSVTINRRWYDGENPDLRFIAKDEGSGTGLKVKGCNGMDIDVMPKD